MSKCCRWALAPPDHTASSQWEMHVTAARAIEAGEEVLLSYGRPCHSAHEFAMSDPRWESVENTVTQQRHEQSDCMALTMRCRD